MIMEPCDVSKIAVSASRKISVASTARSKEPQPWQGA